MFNGLMIFLGWLGLVSGNLLWIGHGIYELVTKDEGFFSIFFTNLGWWVLHMIVSFFLLGVGYVKFEVSLLKK